MTYHSTWKWNKHSKLCSMSKNKHCSKVYAFPHACPYIIFNMIEILVEDLEILSFCLVLVYQHPWQLKRLLSKLTNLFLNTSFAHISVRMLWKQWTDCDLLQRFLLRRVTLWFTATVRYIFWKCNKISYFKWITNASQSAVNSHLSQRVHVKYYFLLSLGLPVHVQITKKKQTKN